MSFSCPEYVHINNLSLFIFTKSTLTYHPPYRGLALTLRRSLTVFSPRIVYVTRMYTRVFGTSGSQSNSQSLTQPFPADCRQITICNRCRLFVGTQTYNEAIGLQHSFSGYGDVPCTRHGWTSRLGLHIVKLCAGVLATPLERPIGPIYKPVSRQAKRLGCEYKVGLRLKCNGYSRGKGPPSWLNNNFLTVYLRNTCRLIIIIDPAPCIEPTD